MKHKNPYSAIARLEVRFNECDPMGIVWHGNYLKYFEEGREAFAKKFDFDYLRFFNLGYATPIVHLTCDFKRPLKYRDIALVEASLRKTDAAKIIFDYIIRKEDANEIICKGSTTQVFVDKNSLELSLIMPEFFLKWAAQTGF